MQIFINNLNSKSTVITVNRNLYVANLKKYIYHLLKIPSKYYKLIYNAKYLNENMTLSQYNIEQYCTINMVLYNSFIMTKKNKEKYIQNCKLSQQIL